MRRMRKIGFLMAGSLLLLFAVVWTAVAQDKVNLKRVKRGMYLVNAVGCGDCHTPTKMGAQGPEPDMTRMLSGHPQNMPLPSAPNLQMPWMASVTATMTAWSGPWGVSFTRNLTPDKETGLGDWTEDNFVATMRTGKRMGKGRQLLPPMPYPAFKNMTDEDLKSIFAYLRTIPVVKNMVPEPIPPATQMGEAK
jgi:mono/diheme cytochrome c family protein